MQHKEQEFLRNLQKRHYNAVEQGFYFAFIFDKMTKSIGGNRIGQRNAPFLHLSFCTPEGGNLRNLPPHITSK